MVDKRSCVDCAHPLIFPVIPQLSTSLSNFEIGIYTYGSIRS